MALIYSATSTGTSAEYNFNAPVTKVAWQSVGPATVTVEGSLGGTSWFALDSNSTSAAGAINTFSTGFLISKVRVVVSAYGSTVGGIRLIGA